MILAPSQPNVYYLSQTYSISSSTISCMSLLVHFSNISKESSFYSFPIEQIGKQQRRQQILRPLHRGLCHTRTLGPPKMTSTFANNWRHLWLTPLCFIEYLPRSYAPILNTSTSKAMSWVVVTEMNTAEKEMQIAGKEAFKIKIEKYFE